MKGTLRSQGTMPGHSRRSLALRARRALIWILACALAPAAWADGLRLASDLAAEAGAASAARVPLIVFFSQPGCDYCERARREYLEPMVAEAGAHAQFRLVEVDITSAAPLADFGGRKLTQAAFAHEHHVHVVPMLAFLGPRGEPLAEPLVGLTLPDFYQAYIDRRLEVARAKLARQQPGS